MTVSLIKMPFLRTLLYCIILVASTLAATAASATDAQKKSTLGDDGLHKQEWFLQSFLDLNEDLAEAQVAGKGLIIAFEQAGCPYCRELHRVNFANSELVTYLRKHFVFVQLDLRGSREVTDFDGKAMEERALARKWGVIFTPTLLMFSKTGKIGPGKSGKQSAAFVMPGYFKPFHFRTMLEFVSAGHFQKTNFQDYVNERAKKLRAEGKEVKVW